jgi:hypothetical protein
LGERSAGDRRFAERNRHPPGPGKIDRLDARALARLLWAGQLDGVWTPDERIRAMRRRLARRSQLVRGALAREERGPRGVDALSG